MEQTRIVWRRDVVELLARLEAERLSELDQLNLLSAAKRYAAVKVPNLAAPPCPCCGGEQVRPTDATAHLVECPRLPARVRYERLSRVAARLSARAAIPSGLEGGPPLTFPTHQRDDDFVQRLPFAQAIAVLGRSDASRALRRDAAWSIRAELRWRLHVADRATDPCPWCGSVSPLETFTAHLVSCERHPGAVRSVVLADALEERLGEAGLREALEEDRALQAREMLELLVRACRAYADDMGWHDHGLYYSKVWSEKPWHRALALAGAFARDERKAPMGPALSRRVLAISTLVELSWQFWNGMDDDGDGRSLIRAQDSERWDERVNEAELALAD